MSNAVPGADLGTRQSPAGGVATVESGSILLVDDEEGVRAVTSVLLRRRGFGVVEAANGHEALSLFVAAPTRYAVLLVDLTMPLMDGCAFLAAVRSLNPTQPVIAMSGHDRRDAARLIGGMAVDGYLQKPFTPEALYEALTNCKR